MFVFHTCTPKRSIPENTFAHMGSLGYSDYHLRRMKVSPERHVDHTADSGMCRIRNCRPARLRFFLSRKSNVETERPGHLQREVVLALERRMVKGYKKGVMNGMNSSERPVLLKQLEPHLTIMQFSTASLFAAIATLAACVSAAPAGADTAVVSLPVLSSYISDD